MPFCLFLVHRVGTELFLSLIIPRANESGAQVQMQFQLGLDRYCDLERRNGSYFALFQRIC